MIEVTYYEKIDKDNSLKAIFDIHHKGKNQYHRNMKLFMKDGRRWVDFHSIARESLGTKSFVKTHEFADKEMMKKFSDIVLKAIDEFCERNNTMFSNLPKSNVDEEEGVPF